MSVACKQGGSDPNHNAKLRDAIAKAKSNNMPNDIIARCLKKASGDLDNKRYEEITYEGYGPGGVAVIVEAMTDNRNRTAGELRHWFDKCGGNLGTNGCVAYLFEKKGQIILEKTSQLDSEAVMMIAIDAGAEELMHDDEMIEIMTTPDTYTKVREALERKGFEFVAAEIRFVPATYTKLSDFNQAESMQKLVDALEDLDDVQAVYHNWEEA